MGYGDLKVFFCGQQNYIDSVGCNIFVNFVQRHFEKKNIP